jgi:hypothetical protein
MQKKHEASLNLALQLTNILVERHEEPASASVKHLHGTNSSLVQLWNPVIGYIWTKSVWQRQ